MNEDKIIRTKELIGGISDSFCLAKWLQTTLYLQNGYNHSCHHPTPHKIPLNEVKENHKALHNTRFKKKQMQDMIDGTRPPECEYCWKVEDLDKNYISDRFYKSSSTWALPKLGEVLENGTEDINPSYLEISFSNVCNFKCVYCSPEISSTWYKEVEKHGGFPTSGNFNSFEGLIASDKMPYDPNGENPYVDAFWKWWPELYPTLHTLRLTGGEPLLNRDVWKILDSLIEVPNPELTLGINTNLCVQDKLIDKLIEKINLLEGKVKEIQLFTSGESTGKQNEYIRYGLDYNKWLKNLDRVCAETKGNTIIAIMTTVNLLSAPSYANFLETILEYRRKYNPQHSFRKVQFMTNYLRYPNFLALPNLDSQSKEEFAHSLNTLMENYVNDFNNLEIDQLKRLIDFAMTEEPTERTNRTDFVAYVDELDNRRDTDFNIVFPELTRYYRICQTI